LLPRTGFLQFEIVIMGNDRGDGEGYNDVDGGGGIMVIADEVDEADETGADISALSASTSEELTSKVEERNQEDIADQGPPTSPKPQGQSPKGTLRPILRREGSAPPPPPQQPPPPAPSSQGDGLGEPTDSLNLAQLRTLVTNFHKQEPTAYAYEYADTQTFAEELDEWFQYTQEERRNLRNMHIAFEREIAAFGSEAKVPTEEWLWSKIGIMHSGNFIERQLDRLKDPNLSVSLRALESIAYISLGAWRETAMDQPGSEGNEHLDFEPPTERYLKSIGQLHAIRDNADILCGRGAVDRLYQHLRQCFDDEYGTGLLSQGSSAETAILWTSTLERRINATLSALYMLVECGRYQIARGKTDMIRKAFEALEPSILHVLNEQIAKIRWDDTVDVPITKVLLLLWKSSLLIIGGSKELVTSKKVLRASPEPDEMKNTSYLTASPLDYHVFRQEVMSKYPAYDPPPALIPLEPENTSILPPLNDKTNRTASQDNIVPAKINKSIFDKAVHIATPAPSPPPSPAGPGGKGGKKQNYQTNQNFPFLYPPLDSTTNDVGGKGSAELKDKFVGKRWDGSDVPFSILEAGELFASRSRMSRSLRQLWEVREDFLKYERGWRNSDETDEVDDDEDIEDFEKIPDLDIEDDKEYFEAIRKLAEAPGKKKKKEQEPKKPTKIRETDDQNTQTQLDLIEGLYVFHLKPLMTARY